MYKHILVPTDGSPLSDEAVAHAVALAAGTGVKITFLTVTEPFHTFSFEADQLEDTPTTYRRHMKERATRILAKAAEKAAASGVSNEVIHTVDDEPYRAIIRIAEQEGCDLIAMASHGRRGMSALVLGSETVKVLTHSTIPVLVYRSPSGQSDRMRHENREAEQMAQGQIA